MDALNSTFGERTGIVFLRHFDAAMKMYLGELNVEENIYQVNVEGLIDEGPVRIVFSQPEQSKTIDIIPNILIRRTSVAPALERSNFLTTEYRIPAPNAVPLTAVVGTQTVSGYSSYEQKAQAWPFDISYDLELYARYMEDAVILLNHVMRKFPPFGTMPVIDSVEETRYYTFFQDGVDDMSELVDISLRVRAFSVGIRIEGELDLKDPIVSKAVLGRNISLEPISPDELE